MSSIMLRKKEVFTIITPIPGFIPRQLAIDILHSHSEVITLNPLVLDHKPIKAPRNAASDEYYSTWYEIEQRIQYIPGIGKIGSGKISFTGCFHDMPWGLQTHIYAPMNVDLKNRYRIAGNQPGIEPPEPQEIGLASLGAPSDGLYLRDDVEIKCNYAVAGFVKSQLKAASKDMVSRIIKKAELLDAGVLHAMIENGRLKTINPNDRTTAMSSPSDGTRSPQPGQPSPTFMNRPGAVSPTPSHSQPYQIPRPTSYQQFNRTGSVSQNAHWSAPYGGMQGPSPPHHHHHHQHHHAKEYSLATHHELPDKGAPPVGPIEMPGDYSFPQPSPRFASAQPSPTYPSDQESTHSSRVSAQPPQQSGGGGGGGNGSVGAAAASLRWSQQSDVSGVSAGGSAMHSPGLPLPTHNEAPEREHNSNKNPQSLDGPLDPVAARRAQYSTPPPGGRSYAYNPADYAKVGPGQQPQQQLRSQGSWGYSQ